jgi:uncharacterized protein (DUF433 family)
MLLYRRSEIVNGGVTEVGLQARNATMSENRISTDPKVMMGKPVIKGTRITVEFILRMLGAGHAVEELTAEYDLSREDILAAQSFAAEYLAHDRILAAE